MPGQKSVYIKSFFDVGKQRKGETFFTSTEIGVFYGAVEKETDFRVTKNGIACK